MLGERVMVCLISRQTMQNLLPILQLEPQRVVFISTRQEDQSRLLLEAVLAQRAVKLEEPRFVDAYAPEETREACRKLVEQFGAGRLIANLTGGTKVMSLAAYQVFADAQVACVYTDTPNRRLLYLYPEGRAPEPLRSLRWMC